MKRKSILGVLLTITVTFCFLLAGCKDPGGGDDSTTGGGLTFAEFETWLDEQPDNTAENPYTVKVNVGDLESISNVLSTNYTKYVNLDLSGSTITSIEEEAFSGCYNLTGITIPNSVTSIGEEAFGMTGLTSVTIPASVTSIEGSAFYYCYSLTAINVDPANSAYTSENGVLYNEDKTLLHTYPAGKISVSFTIPNSVTSIGQYAFAICTRLTSVTIPESVTDIRGNAFLNCTSLASITIPNSVTSIGRSAFGECASLTDVTIPNSVTTIGDSAFAYCLSLTNVTFAVGSNIANANFGSDAFPQNGGYGGNNLKTAYNTGKAGTYKRADNSSTWTKQP